MMGETLEALSKNIDTYSYRQPLGVCAGICPFNFPAMIPLCKKIYNYFIIYLFFFTHLNSGMFPLVNYLSGQKHPLGNKLVNVQTKGTQKKLKKRKPRPENANRDELRKKSKPCI